MKTFSDVLKTKAADVEAPPLVPVGTYTGVIMPGTKIDEEKGTAEFFVKLMSAREDVDQESLTAVGGVSSLPPQRLTKWFVAKEESGQGQTDFNNKRFFVDSLGLEESMSFGEMIAQAPGRQLLVQITHTPSKGGSQMYANIKNTAKA